MLRGVLFGQRKRRYANEFQVVEFWTQPVMTFPGTGTWPDAPPRTWLLEKGWTLAGGLLDTRETSRA